MPVEDGVIWVVLFFVVFALVLVGYLLIEIYS